MTGFLNIFRPYHWYTLLTEWLLIGFVIYWIFRFLRGTRGARLLKGIGIVLIGSYLVVYFAGNYMGLGRISFLYQEFAKVAAFAVAIVFQPELRRAIMRLGETRLFRGSSSQLSKEIAQIVQSSVYLSKRKIGALIAIERSVGLGGIAETGTRVDAQLTSPLLNTIFYPNSPLHDLGVIISQGRIAYAGVEFPMAEEGTLERELGSRHRAAVGLSSETDAVIVVVSEQTGDISIAERGQLLRKLLPDTVRDLLTELLGAPDSKSMGFPEMTDEHRSAADEPHMKEESQLVEK
jgi:diadenylate cyclase